MALTFREDTGAFIGVHRKLTVAEADGNIHTLHLRIADLEGAAGKTIASIEYSLSAITIHYTDSSTDGPFPLPVATLRYVGLWTNNAPYAYLDVVTVATASVESPGEAGVYMALVNHTSPAAPEFFVPDAVDDSDNLLWLPLMPLSPFTPSTVDTISDTTKTLVLADANKYYRCTNVLGCTITVPLNAGVGFDVNTEISFRQANNGDVTIDPVPGVQINPGHPDQATITPWKGATITLKMVGTDVWDYIGPGVAVS